MVGLAPAFAVAIIFAALVGFGGTPEPVAGIAQVGFFLCLIALMISLALSSTRVGDQ
jgi:uncharacterized membrane protein YtjA (UPF0391 family)